jgi:hypothetical protein
MDAKEMQSRLADLGLYTGRIDGLWGPLSRAAAEALFQKENVASWKAWPDTRRVIAVQQLLCKLDGIDSGAIDGLMGPQTRYALEVYAARKRGDKEPETWRDEAEKQEPLTAPDLRSNVWPKQSAMRSFYGAPGTNHAMLDLPFPMVLAWDTKTTINRFSINRKCHDSAKRVYTAVLEHYGIEEIRKLRLHYFGGCYNNRAMRGGSALSTHAYACAIDTDPERNQLRWGRDRAVFAKPEYKAWWDCWQKEGWVSLGIARNFDWMHVQAARL